MFVRVAIALLMLSSCDDLRPAGPDDALDGGPTSCPGPNPGCTWEECQAGDCADIDMWECNETTGQWERTTICEAAIVDVTGDLHLVQSISTAGPTCPALTPRLPLSLFVQDDLTITADSPITIVASSAGGGFGDPGYIDVALDDDWAGVAVSVVYELEASLAHDVEGVATATVADCEAMLAVSGALCPRGAELCAVHEGGWTVSCSQGVVRADDLERDAYCMPDETDEVCEIGGEGNAAPVATCAGPCSDFTTHSFATDEAYAAFDPASLCAP